MKKSLLIFILLFFSAMLSGCSQEISAENSGKNTAQNTPAVNQAKPAADNQPMSSAETVADKLEVYYFHRTARCYSCNTAGEYISGLMATKYSGQIKDGRIKFAEVNVELPENKELARKFQATGSSFYINRIIGNQDNIEQETKVWRYLGNESQFNQYLSDKINTYLNL